MTHDNQEEETYSNEEALRFHEDGKPGKLELRATKPLLTQQDLALAYSPGVAAPCIEIAKDPAKAHAYTARGNFVAVISNGTAVLGLGNLGALASKPVMEGKGVLFKRFADIDAIDLEVDAEDPETFINAVRYLGPSWGGINLEDIKAPDCFIIEERLKELMDIPVFHDDQHGTAIVTAAGLINAAYLAKKELKDMRLVVLGAGSAGIACLQLAKSMGVEEALLVDRTGVIYKGRNEGMNEWKEKFAIETKCRTLKDAMDGADVFYGLSGKGAVTPDMIKSMAKNPIIFAMANPEPEITPEEVAEIRDDAIMATGRSDYNNQVNNVLGFPYIFRGALDCHATTINEEMKIAAAHAIAELARQPVHEEVASAYGQHKEFGPEYIIPSPFDPRLITTVPPAVAKAAMETGVAKHPIEDFQAYNEQLAVRLNPTANTLSLVYRQLRSNPKHIVFAEGEEETVIKAALQWYNNGYGKATLVGREKPIQETLKKLGVKDTEGLHIENAAISKQNDHYIQAMYERLKRKGLLHRDCVRMVKNDRNIFAASILAAGQADIMLTGLTRNYKETLKSVMHIIPPKPGHRVFGLSVVLGRDNRTIFMADTTVSPTPSPEDLASIAIQSSQEARKMGIEPRVAFLSFSNFGASTHRNPSAMRQAVEILDGMDVDFEYDGEMMADVALNAELMQLYPFCRLSKPANILIMPGLQTSNISTKLLRELGGRTLISPILMGLEKPAQIVTMNSSVSDILTIAALAAADSVESA